MFCKSIGGSIQQNFGGKACYNRDMQFKWLRHLKYPAALTAILAIAISAAMLIGRAQPLPEPIALLHLNDMCKLPCWIGITPGVTTVSEAIQSIANVYSAEKGYEIRYRIGDIIIKRVDTNWQLRFLSTSLDDTNVIAVIYLYPSRGLQIVDISTAFGNPYRINLTPIVRDTSYHIDYKFAGIEVTMAGSYNFFVLNDMELKPTRLVCRILLWDGVTNPDGDFEGEKWKGFGWYLHNRNVRFDPRTFPVKCAI